MIYDFDNVKERRGTDSLKWDVEENELPMWIADMDFQTAPTIVEAIRQRAEHGIFGYTGVSDRWRTAICEWWQTQHHMTIAPETLIFCSGVVPAISSLVRKLTSIGENVLVQTPVYPFFFHSIRNNGRNVIENRLIYHDGQYYIDFDDLEEKLAEPQTTMLLLCNPHNPIGKIWDSKTLHRIGELCFKHHVLVIADEIHCDLTDPGSDYVPFASVSEQCAQNSITCIAPTKAFNLAGLQTAAVMIPNEVLRHKAERGMNTDEIAEPNCFAVEAAIAAFTKGADWLDALRAYLYENKQTALEFLEKELPQVKMIPSQATYLLWMDCRKIGCSSVEMADYLRKHVGLRLSAGKEYGGNADCFLRMNIACPKSQLNEALKRLKEGMHSYEEWSLSQC